MAKRILTFAVVAIAVVALLSAVAIAQQTCPMTGKSGSAWAGRGMHAECLVQTLKMTDAQKTQMMSILEDRNGQLKTLFADEKLTREQKSVKAREIIETGRDRIGAMLTPEQRTEFEEVRKQFGQWGRPPLWPQGLC
jgi:Spy/CpxP family protein refolding chaperone